MTVGNLAALLQRNLKRMLAYSSIAHVGYMLMSLAAASTFGISSLLFYLPVCAFTNIGAFVVIIVLARYVEGAGLEQYSGLARCAPVPCDTVHRRRPRRREHDHAVVGIRGAGQPTLGPIGAPAAGDARAVSWPATAGFTRL